MLTVEDDRYEVRDMDERLVIEAPSVGAARRIGEILDLLPAGVAEGVARVPLEIRVNGHRIAYAGPEVVPGVLSRLLGVAPAKVDLLGSVRATLG